VGGKLYAIAGRNPGNLAANEEYDVTNNTWTQRCASCSLNMSLRILALRLEMPSERGDCASVSFGDRVFVFGGSGQSGAYNNTEEFSISLDQWKCRADIPIALSVRVAHLSFRFILSLFVGQGSGAAVVGNQILLIGGAANPLEGLVATNATFLYTPPDAGKSPSLGR
jgi:hypothetical protein